MNIMSNNEISTCDHTDDFSVDDESQHWFGSDQFWFTMACDTCGKIMKVIATVSWDKIKEMK